MSETMPTNLPDFSMMRDEFYRMNTNRRAAVYLMSPSDRKALATMLDVVRHYGRDLGLPKLSDDDVTSFMLLGLIALQNRETEFRQTISHGPEQRTTAADEEGN